MIALVCLLPRQKPRPLVINAFVPTKCTSRVADLHEQLFSFFWIHVSLPSTGFLVRGWATAQEFPRNGKSFLQIIHAYANDFVFLLGVAVLPILQWTVYGSRCCSSFVSVVLTCQLYLQIGNTLQNWLLLSVFVYARRSEIPILCFRMVAHFCIPC